MNDIIDVSRYQGTVNWSTVAKQNLGGAILKTVGTNYSEFGGLYIDPMFEINYAGCKANNIPVGAYFYMKATNESALVDELSLLKTALTNKTFELPIAVDVEDNVLRTLSKDDLTNLVIFAAKVIEQWGFYAMIYTGLNFSQAELDMEKLKSYDIWLAAYRNTRPETPKHGIWQYTSAGAVNGIPNRVDMNHAYKDYPSIIKKAGLTKIR